MLTLSAELFTILVLIGVVFAGLSFFLVFGVIVYLCFLHRHPNRTAVVSPSRSPSLLIGDPEPIPPRLPSPPFPPPGRKVRPVPPASRLRPPLDNDSVEQFHERPRLESLSYQVPRPVVSYPAEYHRNTPYPPDIVAREKMMRDHIQFPHRTRQ